MSEKEKLDEISGINEVKNRSKSVEIPCSKSFPLRNRSPIRSFIRESISWDERQTRPFIHYDILKHAKGAGVIPYTFIDGILHFLFQRSTFPLNPKNQGWNDFGGKKDGDDGDAIDIAAREFTEETNCLFYLRENLSIEGNAKLFELLQHRDDMTYSDNAVVSLKKLLPIAKTYYNIKLRNQNQELKLKIKETYASYFIYVPYIEANIIPKAEDLHVDYDVRYMRECKWISFTELLEINDDEFHKRLQIVKIKARIQDLFNRNLFIDPDFTN